MVREVGGPTMRCDVCGSESLTATEYCAGSVRAPAMECTRCHAIVLDEAVATSDQERDSVRMAVAVRAAQCAAEPLSGSWPEEASDEPGATSDPVRER